MKELLKSVLQLLPDKLFLQVLYYKKFRKFIDFKNPKTFNEKIQHFKLYEKDPIYSQLADKYAVRQYIKDTISEDILIPLLWYGKDPEKIPFETLPEKYIIKCNHWSHFNICVYNKNEIHTQEIKKQLSIWMNEDYSDFLRENHYKNIKEKYILIEEPIPGERGPLPIDYRFNCFRGKPKFIFMSIGRGTPGGVKSLSLDTDWNIAKYGTIWPRYQGESLKKPENFEMMLEYAHRLSKDFAYVRVDLYNVQGKIYFGELTFTPHSGLVRFYPDNEKIDTMLGKLIELPEKAS